MPVSGSGSPGDPAVVESSRKSRWQFRLRTLFLLVAAIAVWLTFLVNREQNARLRSRIDALQPMAHELLIDDPGKIAVVKLEEYWYDENRWDLHLPPGNYRLCLATRDVDDPGLAPLRESVPLAAGRHRIALDLEPDASGWRVRVAVDGAKVLEVTETREWDPGRGSTGGGEYSQSKQFPVEQPLVIFRRRFHRPTGAGSFSTPKGPCEGILLWIEPAPYTKSFRRAGQHRLHQSFRSDRLDLARGVVGSNPAAPTIFRTERFGEHVEGLSHCGNRSYSSTNLFNSRAAIDGRFGRNDGTRLIIG